MRWRVVLPIVNLALFVGLAWPEIHQPQQDPGEPPRIMHRPPLPLLTKAAVAINLPALVPTLVVLVPAALLAPAVQLPDPVRSGLPTTFFAASILGFWYLIGKKIDGRLRLPERMRAVVQAGTVIISLPVLLLGAMTILLAFLHPEHLPIGLGFLGWGGAGCWFGLRDAARAFRTTESR